MLVFVRDQRAILVDLPTEGSLAAEVLPGAPLMTLGVADTLADAFPLELVGLPDSPGCQIRLRMLGWSRSAPRACARAGTLKKLGF